MARGSQEDKLALASASALGTSQWIDNCFSISDFRRRCTFVDGTFTKSVLSYLPTHAKWRACDTISLPAFGWQGRLVFSRAVELLQRNSRWRIQVSGAM